MFEKYLKRKERIIISAIEILDESGCAGLTTKEIARREGISEPAIYRHFSSKLDIVLAILERFAAFDQVIRNTINEQGMVSQEALTYYLESYAVYYQNYPQITTIMFSLDLFRYEETTNQKMMEIINSRHDFIKGIVFQGQASGIFAANVSADTLADIILGQIMSATYWWKINNSIYDLKTRITQTIQWILKQALDGDDYSFVSSIKAVNRD